MSDSSFICLKPMKRICGITGLRGFISFIKGAVTENSGSVKKSVYLRL